MEEIHAFQALRIAKENARINYAMDEIFKEIKDCAKSGRFKAEIVGKGLEVLNDLEKAICIKRLEKLSYKVEETTLGFVINWE